MDGVSLIEIHGKRPRIHDTAFIAPGCRLIGDIEIGPDVSIWYNCVLRADVNFIRIGARTNIQDGSVCHVDSPRPGAPDGHPLIIGEDVLIGHMAMVHGCTLADRSFVGLGAIVMDGCAIDSHGMLAAGAMLTPGRRIGARELWGGRPAKLMRELTDAEVAGNAIGVAHYVENGRAHRAAISGRSAP
ncbi:gamma carbonic anhydrase family protein [Sphingomonas sp. MAH-20]|uniref:Gamma carbonic anhydrase family protein n=1 Tax=Sphingomonas horti TaxID=2682842 RepID=A0A6I4J2M7_9SPHN|nr:MULTISPECIES: gamma carbonic anhydrase family protein [Sphingomonas]MBA2919438.1 gamma carbonic anhydrase family protein [Sphingomonas sp. CGMCC 1.13658]MVO78318.1 gamma carbonic anhydrase family protein [Sphingomonas horti]